MAENLAALRELLTLLPTLRASGVKSLRVGELELSFESFSVAPPVSLALPSSPLPLDEESSEAAERRSLEELLHSSGADTDAILRLMRGKAA